MKPLFEDTGLVLRDGRFVYGWKHGRLRWAPSWLQHLIVSIWNPIACRLWGHEPFMGTCVNCCKKVD